MLEAIGYPTSVVFKVWFLDQQHQYHQGTRQKYRFLGPTWGLPTESETLRLEIPHDSEAHSSLRSTNLHNQYWGKKTLLRKVKLW